MEFCSLSTSSTKDRNILHMTTSIENILKQEHVKINFLEHDVKVLIKKP